MRISAGWLLDQKAGNERHVGRHERGVDHEDELHGAGKNWPQRLTCSSTAEGYGHVEIELTSVSHGEDEAKQCGLFRVWEEIGRAHV